MNMYVYKFYLIIVCNIRLICHCATPKILHSFKNIILIRLVFYIINYRCSNYKTSLCHLAGGLLRSKPHPRRLQSPQLKICSDPVLCLVLWKNFPTIISIIKIPKISLHCYRQSLENCG